MDRESLVSSAINPRANSVTTLFASGWGVIAAYILFSALDAHIKPDDKFLAFLIALFPTIAVWATVERKRWGRLALLGLSAAVVGISSLAACAFFAFKSIGNPQNTINISTPSFLGTSVLTAVILIGTINALWLRRPSVVAEFEQNKRSKLAFTQRIIAAVLVGCWLSIVLIGPAVCITLRFEKIGHGHARRAPSANAAPKSSDRSY